MIRALKDQKGNITIELLLVFFNGKGAGEIQRSTRHRRR